MSKFTIHGDRIILSPVEEEFVSNILMPEVRHRQFQLGKVVAAGPKASEIFKEEDLLIFQVIQDLRTNRPLVSKYTDKDGEHIVQHYKDMIGRLKGPVVKLEDFEIVGDWVLLRAEQAKKTAGNLLLPENLRDSSSTDEFTKYYVVQKGGTVNHGLTPGQEVIVEKTRCNPIGLSGKVYYYVDKSSIYATVMEDVPCGVCEVID